MRSSLVHRVLLSMSMLLVLSTALLGDWWIQRLIIRAQISFEGTTFILLAHPIGHFVTVGLCIFLYWLVIQKSPPDLIISLLFIGIGFLLPLYNSIAFLFTTLDYIRFVYPVSTSNLHLTAAAFIVLIGFINLWRWRAYSNGDR